MKRAERNEWKAGGQLWFVMKLCGMLVSLPFGLNGSEGWVQEVELLDARRQAGTQAARHGEGR